jgi:uncharacterized delta-60 repeat protein
MQLRIGSLARYMARLAPAFVLALSLLASGQSHAATAAPLATPPVTAPTSAGGLDVGFGNQGIVTMTFPGANATLYKVLLQTNGKLIAVGGLSTGELVLVRYFPDGTVDASFGNGGVVKTTFAAPVQRATALIQPDRNILVHVTDVNYATSMVRYLPTGALDPGFGTGGRVLDPGSLFLGLGTGNTIVLFRPYYSIVHYLPNGTPDSSFGNNGRLSLLVPRPDLNAGVTGGFLQPDGKYTLAFYVPAYCQWMTANRSTNSSYAGFPREGMILIFTWIAGLTARKGNMGRWAAWHCNPTAVGAAICWPGESSSGSGNWDAIPLGGLIRPSALMAMYAPLSIPPATIS